MTINFIWLRGSSFKDFGSMEYAFIAIIPKSTLSRSCSTR